MQNRPLDQRLERRNDPVLDPAYKHLMMINFLDGCVHWHCVCQSRQMTDSCLMFYFTQPFRQWMDRAMAG